MSDVQTSPAPAVESAPSSSGEMSSGAETATDSVESPVSSGLVTENSLEASPEASTLTQEGVDNAQETLQAPEFDPESWDGNLDSLPEHLQKSLLGFCAHAAFEFTGPVRERVVEPAHHSVVKQTPVVLG